MKQCFACRLNGLVKNSSEYAGSLEQMAINVAAEI
jgi:hypothetical protein